MRRHQGKRKRKHPQITQITQIYYEEENAEEIHMDGQDLQDKKWKRAGEQ